MQQSPAVEALHISSWLQKREAYDIAPFYSFPLFNILVIVSLCRKENGRVHGDTASVFLLERNLSKIFRLRHYLCIIHTRFLDLLEEISPHPSCDVTSEAPLQPAR